MTLRTTDSSRQTAGHKFSLTSAAGMLAVLSLASCDVDEVSEAREPGNLLQVDPADAGDSDDGNRGYASNGAYEVTVTNLSETQWFTPPVVVAHSPAVALYRSGFPAPTGVREIAENGNLDPLLEALGASPLVSDFAVGVAGDPPPLAPGASVTVELEANPFSRLSVAAMLICTNDGFAGVDSKYLPWSVGSTVSYYAFAYDAGSERNTEDFADIVPPCQALSGVSSDDTGTGASNPELAEDSVVSVHPGIDGSLETSDLTPEAHGFLQPVAVIDVTRIAKYDVTVENLTATQPFTPPVVATHRPQVDVFEVGEVASGGVREIAENGNVGPLVDALEGSDQVFDVVVAAGDPPPILPGMSRTIEIRSNRRSNRLSMVSMLICSNDGFTGTNGARLPRRVGRSETVYGLGYDAGSERNTEDFADIVPPCQALRGVSSDDPGTGASNPALAEDSVIGMHAGIDGGLDTSDLTQDAHGWDIDNPTTKVTIVRTF